MKTKQFTYKDGRWSFTGSLEIFTAYQLVICFGKRELLQEPDYCASVSRYFPEAQILHCSTSGEIDNNGMQDNSIVATAIQLEKSAIRTVLANVKNHKNSMEAGQELINLLPKEELKFVLVFSDGHLVNGSDLVKGFNKNLHSIAPLAGGLAGDGSAFQKTVVGLNDNFDEGNIVATGFYGEHFRIDFGSEGGWDPFGPVRTVTKSEKNVLYEIDGKNALGLYKKYLGEYAEQLPGSALLFPLSILGNENEKAVVRTILAIDEKAKSMTFAGNLPEGSRVKLMRANFDNLVSAAAAAARESGSHYHGNENRLAILISCVGRKLIFGNRIEEEIEVVREVFGPATTIAGFYSYGEISPFKSFENCQLHNQTMTISTLWEE